MARLSQWNGSSIHTLYAVNLSNLGTRLSFVGADLSSIYPLSWNLGLHHGIVRSRSRILTGPITLESCRSCAAATIAFYRFGELHATLILAASLGPFGLNRY